MLLVFSVLLILLGAIFEALGDLFERDSDSAHGVDIGIQAAPDVGVALVRCPGGNTRIRAAVLRSRASR